MQKIAVMIVVKQALLRAGVRYALSRLDFEVEVYDSDPNQNLIALIETNLPHVLLLDIDCPSFRGFDLVREIALRFPTTRVIMLTSNPDDKQLFESIKTGAAAYLDKNVTAEELRETVRRVRRGESPIEDSFVARPKVVEHVLRQFRSIHSNNGKTMEAIVAPLTSRETQVLNHIADGKSNKQIAYILQISELTIKNHVSNILRKLKANDRAHAVALAIHYGWISVEVLELPTYTSPQE